MDARVRAVRVSDSRGGHRSLASNMDSLKQGANVDRKKIVETAMANRLKLENRRLKKEAAVASE